MVIAEYFKKRPSKFLEFIVIDYEKPGETGPEFFHAVPLSLANFSPDHVWFEILFKAILK